MIRSRIFWCCGFASVFADLAENRVLFATPGGDYGVWEVISEELLRRNGHPHALVYAAMDMSPACQRGGCENCRNAQVVFDKFHVMKLLGVCVTCRCSSPVALGFCPHPSLRYAASE